MLIYILRFSPAATLRARMAPGGPAWLWPLIGEGRLPCERFRGYTACFLYREFDRYKPDGQRLYRSYLRIDLAFALVYAPFLAIAVALAWAFAIPVADAWFANIPLTAGLADWLEDGLLLFIVTQYSNSKRHDMTVAIASWVTKTKLVAVIASVGILLFGLIAKSID